MIGELKLEPAARRLGQFAEQARQIAARLDKPGIVVRIADHGVRLDPRRYAKLWSSAIHAVRNAVDHGLESPDARARAGKPNHGELHLASRFSGNEIVIEIRDDGRGIDWAAVRERCEEQGIPSATPEALTAALFRDGLSTAHVVSDLSGRGVGMAVLLAATRELGGRIEIESEHGRGTTVRIVLPRDAERRSQRPEAKHHRSNSAATLA
jgi:two-component system, chemotaxis family, sensor kinase CheA